MELGKLPDPARARSVADLIERLRRLKVWAGNPSYETIKGRVDTAWTAAGRPAGELVSRSTVAYCFQPGRRRLDTELVLAVVRALNPDNGYVARWRQAMRVVDGEAGAASRAQVQDFLPEDQAGFTGRTGELDRLLHAARAGDVVSISAIEGMAGIGKTRLAVRAGHLLHQRQPFERVLFVDLRGFGPDPAQPPADPAAVLDGFLRLLGRPGQQVPHGLDARVAAYRERLAGTRALVVLDNAATAEQVRPLLPATPGCLTLVTSRRHLADLRPATHLAVDVFTAAEALEFLSRAVPGAAVGHDRGAGARIALRCGHLPLALGLIAGHIRNMPGWTLTDHADRLDERHRQGRLDTGVELAFALSYRALPGDRRRLLRLLALHPGRDFDAHAAAALDDTDVTTVQALLTDLHRDHLLQRTAPGRYAFHDLIHAFATMRAVDEDPPPARRVALTRLFDHYLAAASTAVDRLYPTGARARPCGVPGSPEPAHAQDASAWLQAEHTTLVAVAAHTADHGWPTHTTRLSVVLLRYLADAHPADAVTVHRHAHDAARRAGDPTYLSRAADQVADHLRHVLTLHRNGHQLSVHHLELALTLFRQAGDPALEAEVLGNLGFAEGLHHRYRPAP